MRENNNGREKHSNMTEGTGANVVVAGQATVDIMHMEESCGRIVNDHTTGYGPEEGE